MTRDSGQSSRPETRTPPTHDVLHRLRLALPLAMLLFTADCATKQLAETYLRPEHVAHPVIGDVLQFTLAYNTGAAMSLPIGAHGKVWLIAFSLVLLGGLLRMALVSPPGFNARQVALGLLIGGTIGNLMSRMISERGVVDFVDIGIGATRFWVFNVADVCITVGACVLAIALQRANSGTDGGASVTG